jgi:ornithine--oxo-acid transaminase
VASIPSPRCCPRVRYSACAVARAALRVVVEEDLSGRSAELGAYALDRLRALKSPQIAAVRGKGLWLAIELNAPARPFCEALKARGVLCKETHETVIRLAPPLVIDRADLDWGIDQIAAVVDALVDTDRLALQQA